MISGKSTLVAHIGYPTESFKASFIYNPWFDKVGIDAVVVPMGVKADAYPDVLRALSRFTNLRGALVTMPHKVTTVSLVDECTTTVKIAGSCNAVLLRPDGTLLGDMFDGTGFTRGLRRKGFAGAKCLVVRPAGSGRRLPLRWPPKAWPRLRCAITTPRRSRARRTSSPPLSQPRRRHTLRRPRWLRSRRQCHAAGHECIRSASIRRDATRAATFVGEVVMKQEITPLLHAAREKGCRFQVGTDMLFEMIPAYLEFFGFGTATPDELRAVAKVAY
jgi:shikimate dehydrogenase